ncbi:Ras family protein [Trichomonas vaginalis G3]|uniref:Ras-related protein Rab-21 n=2 Tax=Trichomonas vaginalis TaxID=5722 RepID=A0A8U0WPZ8_TRIV3|nr:small Rab GTPase RabE1 [Trichomonas vaginalis G3]AAX97474.1 small Rab GTPase RabE1 [Trichomonas vaginalis]EAY17595.1 Ras family protein [Trichomonas vaginalis G3]KAI5520639.1 small Rab GTPase RabE1 [Trichomonas vaginalis G3]|eukprot:XP_001329730.1 Ras family protein [Trichomonas vaginalis G3]
MSYKVVLLGEGRVGKSSIGNKWQSNTFDPQRRSTIAAAFFQKTVICQGKNVDIQLWDTAGQEEYHSLAPIYYKDAQAALLVYSVIDSTSFERMMQWKNELVNTRGENIKLIIAANKIDMVSQRVITPQQGLDFANKVGCQIFEVSAKTGEGIDMLFQALAKTLLEIPQKKSATHRSGKVGLQVINGNNQEAEENNSTGCGC